MNRKRGDAEAPARSPQSCDADPSCDRNPSRDVSPLTSAHEANGRGVDLERLIAVAVVELDAEEEIGV